MPNVCQKEKISLAGKKILFPANFLSLPLSDSSKNPVKYCYLTGTKQKTNTMNKWQLTGKQRFGCAVDDAPFEEENIALESFGQILTANIKQFLRF